jgi:hypothetical protein
MKKHKNLKIGILYIVGLLTILTPLMFFLIYFKDNSISSLQSDWADFGTFIGGILTPIISILSLVILIYIYFEIENLSNKNNHNLYVLQKKMEAFEKLQSYTQEFSQLTIKMHQIKNQVKSPKFKDLINLNEKTLTEVRGVSNSCTDFHVFIKHFSIRYNHIFNKGIESSCYSELIKNTEILQSDMTSYYFDLLSNNKDEYKEGEQPFWNFEIILNKLKEFSELLKSELKR